jgi:hypothetical protein
VALAARDAGDMDTLLSAEGQMKGKKDELIKRTWIKGPNQEVVLHIVANSWKIIDDRDVECLEQIAWSDAR